MTISCYNPNTGIDVDIVNSLTVKTVSICLFNKGKISREEFFNKLKEPILEYSSFLKQRLKRYQEELKERREKIKCKKDFREAIRLKKEHPLEVSILNRLVKEFNGLSLEKKMNIKTITCFETGIKDIANGYCNLEDKEKLSEIDYQVH